MLNAAPLLTKRLTQAHGQPRRKLLGQRDRSPLSGDKCPHLQLEMFSAWEVCIFLKNKTALHHPLLPQCSLSSSLSPPPPSSLCSSPNDKSHGTSNTGHLRSKRQRPPPCGPLSWPPGGEESCRDKEQAGLGSAQHRVRQTAVTTTDGSRRRRLLWKEPWTRTVMKGVRLQYKEKGACEHVGASRALAFVRHLLPWTGREGCGKLGRL